MHPRNGQNISLDASLRELKTEKKKKKKRILLFVKYKVFFESEYIGLKGYTGTILNYQS